MSILLKTVATSLDVLEKRGMLMKTSGFQRSGAAGLFCPVCFPLEFAKREKEKKKTSDSLLKNVSKT